MPANACRPAAVWTGGSWITSPLSGEGSSGRPPEALISFHLATPVTVTPVSYQEAQRLQASVPPQKPRLIRRPVYAYPYPYYGYAYPYPYVYQPGYYYYPRY